MSVIKGLMSGISGAARGFGSGLKSVGSAALKPLSVSRPGSIRTVKVSRPAAKRTVKLRRPAALTHAGTGKRVYLGDKYSNLHGTFKKADRKAAISGVDARRAKAAAKPKKLKRPAPGTTYHGKTADRKKLKPGERIKLKPGKAMKVVTPKPDAWTPKKGNAVSPSNPKHNPYAQPATNAMPAGAADPYGGLSPQQMKEAGFASAQEYAHQVERAARTAIRSKTPRSGSTEEKGRWGMKTPDFALNFAGRNRLDPGERDFINEQRETTQRHKRAEFEWKQAPRDRRADRHWNLINTGKVVYMDGKANSDVGAINRELHRDRSLESFERKFNREWNRRLNSRAFASLSPDQQKVARDDLYDRMRRSHDRKYSFGRAFAGWNAERKAERRQRKEDARNLKNIRMIRGWY